MTATDEMAKNAIKILLSWIGEDCNRQELNNTLDRSLENLRELFSGYKTDPLSILNNSMNEIKGYNEIISLINIKVLSYCEHDLMPILGKAYVAYIPNVKIVGIDKLAKVVDVYCKRLQVQERLTLEIAQTLHLGLEPQGVAVVIIAKHLCMKKKYGSRLWTQKMLGVFEDNEELQKQFLTIIKTEIT